MPGHGIRNNVLGKNAEDVVRRMIEARGFKVEKALSGCDFVCYGGSNDSFRFVVEVKSKHDMSRIKYRRFVQLTSRKQEKFLKCVFMNKVPFKLFVVFFPSGRIKEYDRSGLDLRLYQKRLGYLRIRGERLRNRKTGQMLNDSG
jgi:hypothetical protein